MRVKIGDMIRADAGSGQFWNGVVDSVGFGKIRVRIPNGQIVEVYQHGKHTVNGLKKAVDANGPVHDKLLQLDDAGNLSEWEEEFVGDLLQRGTKHFSQKQEEMVDRIYNRRILENA